MIVIDKKAMISQRVFHLLQGYAEGEILLVSSKGIYLQLNEQVLILTAKEYGLIPIGIGLEDFPRVLSPLCLEVGQPVRYFDSQLEFPGGVLRLHPVLLRPADISICLLPQRLRECAGRLWHEHRAKGISPLCGPLLLERSLAELPQMNRFCQRSYPHLSGLMQTMQANADPSPWVKQLIGLGVGLTPSGDDVLLGMLYTLLRIPKCHAAARQLQTAIREHAPTGTNTISAAYLLAVAEGASYGRLDELLQGLSGQMPLDINPILEIGSSSGSEMLLGLLLAAHISTNTP